MQWLGWAPFYLSAGFRFGRPGPWTSFARQIRPGLSLDVGEGPRGTRSVSRVSSQYAQNRTASTRVGDKARAHDARVSTLLHRADSAARGAAWLHTTGGSGRPERPILGGEVQPRRSVRALASSQPLFCRPDLLFCHPDEWRYLGGGSLCQTHRRADERAFSLTSGRPG